MLENIAMAENDRNRRWVMVNRAPVLTLWAAVVPEVLGFEYDEALTLGRAVAGLNAYSKGVSLGLFQPTPREVKELAEKAYALYEKFRPEIPPGKTGWGASGKLELDLIRHAVKVVSLPRRKE
jgi:hypothetical protein